MNQNNDNALATYVGKKHSRFNNNKSNTKNPNRFFPPRDGMTYFNSFDKRNVKYFYYKKLLHVIKDYRKILAYEATSNNKKQSNIVINNNNLYVVALIVKQWKDPTWYNIDIKVSQYKVQSQYNDS